MSAVVVLSAAVTEAELSCGQSCTACSVTALLP
jgi:hypothetical protein